MDFTWDMWLLPIQTLWSEFQIFAPKLITSILFLVAGFMLAWMVHLLVLGFCKAVKIDGKVSHLWFFRVWSKSLYGQKPSRFIAKFFYYIILFIFILLAVRVIGGETSAVIIGSLLSLVPRVFSFMLILLLGFLMAMFLSIIAQVILAGSNIPHPKFWGKAVALGTFGIAVVFSIEQLGLAGTLVSVILLTVLGSLGLAFAIAAGLGCKDLVREFIIELLKKDHHEKKK